jgi:prepilin-type N-terminal cleavage/methylation domain-containing protein
MTQNRKGFSLFELLIVIFILSLLTALAMPRLWGSDRGHLKSEAKRISNTLRYIYDEAAGKKRTYELTIDLSRDQWGFSGEGERRSFHMKDNVIFRDVVVPSLGLVSVGEITMQFGPLGPEEPIVLHLTKNNHDYTVMFNHSSGRARIREGYIQE